MHSSIDATEMRSQSRYPCRDGTLRFAALWSLVFAPSVLVEAQRLLIRDTLEGTCGVVRNLAPLLIIAS